MQPWRSATLSRRRHLRRLTAPKLICWRRGSSTQVFDEEVRQQFGPRRNGILVEVRDPGVDQNLFVNKEVAGALSAVANEDGIGRGGHDLGATTVGNRFVAA